MKVTETTRQTLIEAGKQEQACRHLADFVRFMWEECEPRDLVWGGHLSLLCQELEWLAEGKGRCLACWDPESPTPEPGEAWGGPPDPECPECEGAGLAVVRELVVTIPPGHMKSWLCSVLFPAWLWLRDPALYLLTLANDGDLAGRDSRRMRDLVLSDRYELLKVRMAIREGKARANANGEIVDAETGEPFAPWGMATDQQTKVNFENDVGGGRNARGVFGKITGKRSWGLLVDDPHDAKEVMLGDPAKIAQRMRQARIIYHGALRSRLNKGAWRLVVMQRLHVADLAGDLIRDPGVGTRIVCLPVRYEPDHPEVHPGDNREPDEWLCEAAFSEEEEEEVSRRMTPLHYGAQFKQRPSSEAGGRFKRAWFAQRYEGEPMMFAAKARFDWIEILVDCAFKDTPTADYVAITVWGWKRGQSGKHGGCQPGRYLLDRVHARMDIIDTCQALRDLKPKWPQTNRVTVEAKANGDAVIQTLRREGHEKVVGYNPKASKEARAGMAAVSFQAGDVWLPEAENAPWISDWIEEHVAFPAGAHDDQVDTTSMCMLIWDEEADTGGDLNADYAWMRGL